MARPVALITGSTSGLGAAFADELAAQGYQLVLVARGVEALERLARRFHAEQGAQCETLAADLATEGGRARVADRLADGVDLLVNNAGIATNGEFWTADPALLQRQLDVNVTAVMQLTRAALAPMVAVDKGAIINVASVAGLLPGRGSSYSASKAYVISFTEGLAGGLADTSVRLQALCPGFMRTQFHSTAGIDMRSIPRFMWLPVADVVRHSLADLAADRLISIPGRQYRALTTIGRYTPRSLVRLANSTFGAGRGRT